MNEMLILNFVVFVLFGLILCYKMQILWHKNAVYEDVISKTDSLILRGIAAVFIIFSHYITYVGEYHMVLGPAKIYVWFGGLGVCIFFFISGYGIETTYKDTHINFIFLKKRFLNVIPAYFFLRIVFGLLEQKQLNGLWYFAAYVLGIYEPLWFVTEILIIYLLYYLSRKLFDRYPIISMTLLLVVMSIIMYQMGLEARWYNANLVFVLGMLAARYRIPFTNFFKKNYCLKMLLTGMLFACLGIWYSVEKGSVLSDILKLTAGSFFCVFFVGIILKIRFQSNFIKWIGKKSLYIYIVHLEVWKIFDIISGGNHKNLIFQFIVCLIGTLVFTYLYCKAEDMFKSIFLTKRKD